MTRRGQWLAAAVAGVVLLALVAAVALWPEADEERVAPLSDALPARPAAEFVDSIGVNIHLTYYDTAYARFDEWSRLLIDLGVRHVRDGLVFGGPVYERRMRRLADQGVRFSLITSPKEGPAARSVGLAAGPLRPAVETLEGPNEPDIDPSVAWQPVIRRFVPDLRRAVDARFGDDVPLLAPSFVNQASRSAMDDIADLWDFENIHPYPGGGPPVPPDRGPGGDRPVMATESGYHNAIEATVGQPPVSEDVTADYVPRLYAEYFAAGVRRTFLYELIDEKPNPRRVDPEQHFGLLRQDLSPKPAYVALKRLLQIVEESPGDGPRRDVRIEGAVGELHHLLLDRADGSRLLLLWRPISLWDQELRDPTPQDALPVDLVFGGPARDASVTYLSRDAEPMRRDEADRISVAVGGDLVAVSYR